MMTKKIKKALSLGLLLFLLLALYLGGRSFLGGSENVPGKSKEAAPEETPSGGAAEEGIHLSREAVQNMGLEVEAVEVRAVEEVMTFTGGISPEPDQEVFVTSRIPGKVERVYVNLGEPVKQGQLLAEIRSLDFENLQVELFRELTNEELLHIDRERIKNLVEKKIAASKELAKVEADHQKVEGEINGLKNKLLLLGLKEEEVERLVQTKQFIPVLPVLSPITGQVVERAATVGGAVDPQDKMFHIINLSRVLVEGDIPEDRGGMIRKGQEVRVRVSTYPDEAFAGRINYISDVVDPQKRTIHLWSAVPNPDRKLKPGMFARVSVITEKSHEAVAVPIRAILEEGAERFVFVQNGDEFIRQTVVLGVRDDRYVEVKEGLMPGDQVVTRGNQQLMLAQMSSGSTGGGDGHTH
jgi:cobalt-zinc-cadmium efflux system membrane fusion protein